MHQIYSGPNLARKATSHSPLLQFQELAKTVSRTSSRPKSSGKYGNEKLQVSPRQEIYKSLLREIKSTESPQMSSLIHKASGILRLNHYKDLNKNPKVQVSWDIDGRRVLTYEEQAGVSKTALQRETVYQRSSKKNLLESLNEPIFGLGLENFRTLSKDYSKRNYDGSADCERRSTPVSKLWEDYIDTGDVSKLWASKEAIIPRSKRSYHHHQHRSGSITSVESRSSTDSYNIDPHPPWKTFVKPSKDRIKSWETTKTLWGSPKLVNSSTGNLSSVKDGRQKSRHPHSTHSNSRRMEPEVKVDRVQHICVVNGSVVTFKDFGFENFTNWFGDESTLEANQQRSQPKFHLEVDLSNVENKDVKIRFLEGHKLEIEAKRKIEGSRKPLRVKDYLHIPDGFRAEDLLLCRTKTGKLIVEELTPEPIEIKAPSKTTIPKSKSKNTLKQPTTTTPKDRKRARV